MSDILIFATCDIRNLIIDEMVLREVDKFLESSDGLENKVSDLMANLYKIKETLQNLEKDLGT